MIRRRLRLSLCSFSGARPLILRSTRRVKTALAFGREKVRDPSLEYCRQNDVWHFRLIIFVDLI